jgi:gamma-glutamyltranspeptidase / glutathione hydrolase
MAATVSVCLGLTVIGCLAAFAGPGGGDRVTGQPFATRSPGIAQHGIAAMSQPLATQIAIDILKAGGSAVDAAIGANAALGCRRREMRLATTTRATAILMAI